MASFLGGVFDVASMTKGCGSFCHNEDTDVASFAWVHNDVFLNTAFGCILFHIQDIEKTFFLCGLSDVA